MKTALVALTAAFAAVANAAPVRAFLTTADQQHLLAPSEVARPGARADPLIRIHPQRQHQRMAGFGAALTEGSAWLIRNGLTDKARDALMRISQAEPCPSGRWGDPRASARACRPGS